MWRVTNGQKHYSALSWCSLPFTSIFTFGRTQVFVGDGCLMWRLTVIFRCTRRISAIFLVSFFKSCCTQGFVGKDCLMWRLTVVFRYTRRIFATFLVTLSAFGCTQVFVVYDCLMCWLTFLTYTLGFRHISSLSYHILLHAGVSDNGYIGYNVLLHAGVSDNGYNGSAFCCTQVFLKMVTMVLRSAARRCF